MSDTPAPQRDVRASDAERDAAVAELGAHFQAGRLDLAEFDDRTGQALRAKTRRELGELLADLPRGGTPAGALPPRPELPRRLRPGQAALAAAALAAVALAVAVPAAAHGHRYWVPWWLIPLAAVLIRRWWWRQRAITRNGR